MPPFANLPSRTQSTKLPPIPGSPCPNYSFTRYRPCPVGFCTARPASRSLLTHKSKKAISLTTCSRESQTSPLTASPLSARTVTTNPCFIDRNLPTAPTEQPALGLPPVPAFQGMCPYALDCFCPGTMKSTRKRHDLESSRSLTVRSESTDCPLYRCIPLVDTVSPRAHSLSQANPVRPAFGSAFI